MAAPSRAGCVCFMCATVEEGWDNGRRVCTTVRSRARPRPADDAVQACRPRYMSLSVQTGGIDARQSCALNVLSTTGCEFRLSIRTGQLQPAAWVGWESSKSHQRVLSRGCPSARFVSTRMGRSRRRAWAASVVCSSRSNRVAATRRALRGSSSSRLRTSASSSSPVIATGKASAPLA